MSEEKRELFIKISGLLRQLAGESDITIYTLYNPALGVDAEAVDYRVGDKSVGFKTIPLDFLFEGIGVWYIIKRYKQGKEDIFKSVKILVYMQNGQFIKGQVGDFEGFWTDFPIYVSEDRWVQNIILNPAVNDYNATMPEIYSA